MNTELEFCINHFFEIFQFIQFLEIHFFAGAGFEPATLGL